MKFMLAIVYFVITFSAGLMWGFRGTGLWMLVLLGLNQFLISFILYLRSNVSALLFFKTDSVLSVLDRILMIIFCSILLWGNVTSQPMRIEWFVYAQTLSYILTALVALMVVIRKASFTRLNWNVPFFVMIIKQSLPFAVLVLLMTFYNRFDSVLIQKLIPGEEGKIQVGIYAHGYRLLDAANNIAYLVSVLLLPLFARQLKSGEKVENLARLSFTLLFVLSVIVAAGSYFYSYPIMDLLYDHYISNSAVVFSVLMGCFIGYSTTYVFGTLLTANGSLKHLNLVAAGGMLLNIGLNLVLIPWYGALGAAWASLLTQLLMAAIQVVLAVVMFRFRFNPRYLITLVVFVAGVILISRITSGLPLHWIKSFALMMGASIILALALGLFNIRRFLHLVASRNP